ncbi:hypothetical protein ACIRJS_44955 [Streptomyces sp. NPDC102340]|uniref:hypothetical protein n=1 Tax=unclassified Streptomyces TaxID=2593676 RepID=UPI0038238DA0
MEKGLGARDAPSAAGNVESVGDEVAGCAFDNAAGDGPASGEGPVIVDEGGVVGEVLTGFVGGLLAASAQDTCGLDGNPVLGSRIGGSVEAAGPGPKFLDHVDQVEGDVDGHAAALGLGLDQAELVAGAVDEDHPAPVVLRVTGLGLVEGGDDMLGIVLDRSCQPLGLGFRPGRGVRAMLRPPGGAMMSCGRRTAGSAS